MTTIIADPDNYLVAGLDVSVGTGFIKAPSDGTVVMGGVTMTITGIAVHAFTAQRTTYRDLKSDGTFAYLEAYFDEEAFAPAVTDGALRIGLTKTDTTGVTEDRILVFHLYDMGPDNQVFPASPVIPPIPPEDEVSGRDYKPIGYSGALGDPVYLAADGLLYKYDGTENAADRFAGILVADAVIGSWAQYAFCGGLVTGLSGLTVGRTLYAVAGGLLVHKEDFETPTYEGTWAREAATPLSATSLRAMRGEILPEIMILVANAGENLPTALVPVYINTDGNVYLVGTDEISVVATSGILKTTALAGNRIEIYRPGQEIPGFSGLTMGIELWASGGILKPYASVGAKEWARSVGCPISTTELLFNLGEPLGHI